MLNNKVLVLGGCGYIGSSLFNFLQNKGLEIDTVDLEWYGNYTNPKNINVDFKNLTPMFLRKYGSIVLLAGHSSVPMCVNNMRSSFKNNVENFVDLLTKLDAKQRFIYASSSSVYGVVDSPVEETHNYFDAISFYDITKQHIDQYASLSGKNFYGLRFGTVNGASSNLRVDIMMNAMVNSIKNGGHINLVNGKTKRPILYLNDLNRAIHSIIASEEDHPGIYNLASFNSTAGEIAHKVAEVLKSEVKTGPDREIVYDFMINSSKFCSTYDFKFEGDMEKIIYNLYSTYDDVEKTNRNEAIKYE